MKESLRILLLIIIIIMCIFLTGCNITNQNTTKREEDFQKQFKLYFNEMKEEKISKIIDSQEIKKYNYNVYTYQGSVDVIINNERISLKTALLENKITVEEIIEKAKEDLDAKKIKGDMYLDGGSMMYNYETYTIIKCNTLDGNKDVYIGTPKMTLNDVI